jgi:hypothetical protein
MLPHLNNSRSVTPMAPSAHIPIMALLVAAQLVLSCGCAVVPSRPAQVPALVSAREKLGETPSISGTYTNEGEAFTVNGKTLGSVLLSRLLYVDKRDANTYAGGFSNKVAALYGPNAVHLTADCVTVIEPRPDCMEIQFFHRGESVAVRRFSKYAWHWSWDTKKLGQPYYAVKGFLDINTQEEHGGASGIGGFHEAEDCLFRKAVDGSLIVLHRQQFFGIFVIVPFWGTESMWCRFAAIETNSQDQASSP